VDGLLLLLWHKEQRAAGTAGYGVADATPLTLRNSIIPESKQKLTYPIYIYKQVLPLLLLLRRPSGEEIALLKVR
jgi:hypothetical protein